MRAIIQTAVGGPEVLVEKDVDTPEISNPYDVLIRVVGCGICYRDTLVRRGFMRARLPVIPGHEVVGEVVEYGDGVPGLRKGDVVASLIYIYDHQKGKCESGYENICRGNLSIGEDINGCYAEYVKLPYWVVSRIGDSAGNIEGYSISACVIGTAVRGIKYIGQARKDESILITGAGGGVGIHAIQVAKALGLRVIAVTRSESKVDAIRKAGADEVVLYSGGFVDEVRKLTDGEGVDIVYESVGGPTLEQSVRSLRKGGRVLLVGNVDPRPQSMLLGLVILKEIKILGVLNATPRELREAINLIRGGRVKPVYTKINFDLDEVRNAHRLLEQGKASGRYVISFR